MCLDEDTTVYLGNKIIPEAMQMYSQKQCSDSDDVQRVRKG